MVEPWRSRPHSDVDNDIWGFLESLQEITGINRSSRVQPTHKPLQDCLASVSHRAASFIRPSAEVVYHRAVEKAARGAVMRSGARDHRPEPAIGGLRERFGASDTNRSDTPMTDRRAACAPIRSRNDRSPNTPGEGRVASMALSEKTDDAAPVRGFSAYGFDRLMAVEFDQLAGSPGGVPGAERTRHPNRCRERLSQSPSRTPRHRSQRHPAPAEGGSSHRDAAALGKPVPPSAGSPRAAVTGWHDHPSGPGAVRPAGTRGATRCRRFEDGRPRRRAGRETPATAIPGSAVGQRGVSKSTWTRWASAPSTAC